MNFTKDRPDKVGFYWCKPVFGYVGYTEADDTIEKGLISIAQVVELKQMHIGSFLHVRFIGHKYPYSINSPMIQDTLWGDEIESPKTEG